MARNLAGIDSPDISNLSLHCFDNYSDKVKRGEESFPIELSCKVAETQLQLTQEVIAKLEKEREQLAKTFEQKLEEWKQKEIDNTVKVELEKWRQEMEKEIRRDATKSSITTLLGKLNG